MAGTIEEGWERRTPRPDLPRARIEAALGRPVRAVRPLDGGCVNLNLQVELDRPAERAVLRVHLRDPGAAPREAALLVGLAGRLPVPPVLGRGEIEVDAGAGPAVHPWLLLGWVPGRPLAEVLEEPDAPALDRAGAGLGRALAALHAWAPRERLGFLDAHLAVEEPLGRLATMWQDLLEAHLGDERVRERLGPDRRRDLAALARAEAGALEALEGRYAILHADFKPTNVLVAPDGTPTGLLDWEFAWAGPPLFDLGQMLRWPVPPAFEEALLQAYVAAGGTLPDGWRRHARLLDLMNLVGFLAWPGERPRHVRDVLHLLDASLASLAR